MNSISGIRSDIEVEEEEDSRELQHEGDQTMEVYLHF